MISKRPFGSIRLRTFFIVQAGCTLLLVAFLAFCIIADAPAMVVAAMCLVLPFWLYATWGRYLEWRKHPNGYFTYNPASRRTEIADDAPP